MMLHQVEFLIEGYLLPPTIGRLCVSEELILESVWRAGSESRFSHEPANYVIAYVGVAAPEESNYFPAARDHLDFFLLIYSLISGQPVTSMMGIGTTLDDMSSLGTKRVGWSSFEKIHVLNERWDDLFCKPILDTKRLFLLLLPDRQKIMESPLGLALTFYYFAVLASRRRLEEAVIDLMIAGEALLIARERDKKKNLSRRLSTLIAEDEKEKAEISEKMLKLYKLRSDIVHGEGVKPSFDDVKILFDYMRRAVERGLSLRHLSKKELIAKLDKANVDR
jgi:hypothetical protein